MKKRNIKKPAQMSAAKPFHLHGIGAAVAAMLMTPAVSMAQSEETKALNQIDVKSTYEQGAVGYNASTTNVGKTMQAAKDIPQAITIVPKELIKDKNDDSLKDALRNVAGLTFNAGEGGRIGDNMNLRGFYSFGDLYSDGIRDTAQYNREVFNLEQIDVLRGSGSMLFGRGQAGGVINQVHKKPFMTDMGEVSGTVGSYDYYRTTGDFNKVIDEASSTALRINVMKHDSKSSRDVVASEREGVAPTLTWGIGTANQVSLSHYYLKTNNVPDYGVGFVKQRPTPTMSMSDFSGTTRDHENNITNMTTLAQELTIDSDTKLNTKVRFSSFERDLLANKGKTSPSSSLGGIVTRGAEEKTQAFQSDFSKKMNVLGKKHEMLTGIEYFREDLSRWGYDTTSTQSSKNSSWYTSPVYNLNGSTPRYTSKNDISTSGAGYPSSLTVSGSGCSGSVVTNYILTTDNCLYGYGSKVRTNPASYLGNSYSIYFQDTISLSDYWKVMAGVRNDWMNADYWNSSSGASTLKFSEKSYRSGVIFQPDAMTSYYLAWNSSFNPTADLYQLTATTPFPAERSSTTELGGKWDLFGGDLALRTALFKASKDWERNTDLEGSGGLLSKKRYTNGFEVELAGRISNQWEIFGGVAILDSKIDSQYEGTSTGQTFQQYVNANSSGKTTNIAWTSQGYKVDAAGNLVLDSSTDYRSNIVYIDKYSQSTVGKTPRNTSPYTFNLWTTYKLDSAWKVGFGAEGKGRRLAYGISRCDSASYNETLQVWSYSPCSAAFNPNVAPAFIRFDSMISYSQKDYAWKLNVLNLTNRNYYDAVYDNGGFIIPGSKRAFQLTGTYKF